MARNEGDEAVGHVMRSASPFVGIAMSHPGAVIGLFVIFSMACVLFAIVQGLRATVDVWGPYLLLSMAAGAVYAGHRWLWGPLAEDPRTPRRITGSILALAFLLFELCSGRAGLLVGSVTGINPEAVIMDAGFPVTDSMRQAIAADRSDREKSARCMEALKDGRMFEGTSGSVNWAMNCSRHMMVADQRQSCLALDARKGNAVSYVNEEFCAGAGISVRHRDGANWAN